MTGHERSTETTNGRNTRSGALRTVGLVVGGLTAIGVVASAAAIVTFNVMGAESIAAEGTPSTIQAPPTTAPVDQPDSTTTIEVVPLPILEPEPVLDPEVAAQLSTLTTWDTPTAVSVDSREGSISSGPVVSGAGRNETVCQAQGLRVMSTVFTEFPVNAFQGNALPGLVVEGGAIDQADLRVVPLARAPFELVSTADSFENVQMVAAPESSDIQQAVTALKRDADARIGGNGIDVISGDITYSKSETHSFEQTSLELGISLHYRSVTSSAGFEGTFAMDEAVQQHSIVVRLVQPMFTISMELDSSSSPADFFAAEVTEAEVDALIASGRLGTDNPPVVIDSVTYGRVMYYTLTSSEVESATELTAIVDGSYNGIDGEASLSAEQREVLSRSEVQLIAYGGDQSQALAAIQSGDLSRYFGPANTATAAPLTMTMRTLDGVPIDVADEATLQQVVCTDTARPFEFLVNVSDIDNGTVTVTTDRGGSIGEASERSNPDSIDKKINSDLLEWGWNKITFSFTATGPACANVWDVEEFEASIRSRPTVGDGDWSSREGRISLDENRCSIDFNRWVNPTTGGITSSNPN